MDDQTQGIVDQPVSDDEMAAVDNAASQFGQVIQPTNTDDSTVVQPDNSPSAVIEPSTNATDTPIADALNNSSDEPSTPEGNPVEGGLAAPSDEPVIEPVGPTVDPAPAAAEPALEVPEPIADETPEPVVAEEPVVAPVEPAEVSQPGPVDETPVPAPVSDDDIPTPAPVGDEPVASEEPVISPVATSEPAIAPVEHPPIPASEGGDGTDDELLEVKQQALQELTPIVSTIDLPPEERFDTYMMIIRASDDKKLVKPAYDAANQIVDQDKKARALLDVVNEVNYLTQNGPQSQQIAPEN